MKLILLIFLFAFPIGAYCQSTTEPSTSKPYHFAFLNESKNILTLNSTLPSFPSLSNQSYIPASTVPERLPMFCALEKKLKETCNVWIKIRLPEHP